MYEVLSPEYIVEGETSNNTPELKNDTVVMCGTESDFTPFDISLFYEASLQSYVRYGHISPKTTLEEWKDTREDIRSYYVMIRNGNNLIAGAKLIQNIDLDNQNKLLSPNSGAFPMHSMVGGYDYPDYFNLTIGESLEATRLFVKNNHSITGESVMLAMVEFINRRLNGVKGIIGIGEKKRVIRLIQFMEHLEKDEVSSVYTYPNFQIQREILEGNFAPYFKEKRGIPFLIDLTKYLPHLQRYYKK